MKSLYATRELALKLAAAERRSGRSMADIVHHCCLTGDKVDDITKKTFDDMLVAR